MGKLIDVDTALDALDRFSLGQTDAVKLSSQMRHYLEHLPPAQPTLYGYDIKHLAFIAAVVEKEGMSPEEVVAIFRDLNRVIEMMLEDMKEMQENALKQTLKKPWERGQDEQN